MTKRQTKFGRHDVNGQGSTRCAGSRKLFGTARRSTDWNQQLSWRGFAVRQNVSNCRCKLINAGAGHDDAVTAAVSFFRDAQEPPALIFPKLDVEMLSLNLQFFRLDDVIHFALRAPSLGNGTLKWKKNSRPEGKFLIPGVRSWQTPGDWCSRPPRSLWQQGCRAPRSIYNLVRLAT